MLRTTIVKIFQEIFFFSFDKSVSIAFSRIKKITNIILHHHKLQILQEFSYNSEKKI